MHYPLEKLNTSYLVFNFQPAQENNNMRNTPQMAFRAYVVDCSFLKVDMPRTRIGMQKYFFVLFASYLEGTSKDHKILFSKLYSVCMSPEMNRWRCRVSSPTVRIPAFQAGDPGSTPG